MKGHYEIIHGDRIDVDDVIECDGGTLHLVGVNGYSRAVYEGRVKNAWVRAVYTIWPENKDLDVFIGNSKEELDYEGYVDPDTGVIGEFEPPLMRRCIDETVDWANQRGYLRRRT